MACSELPDWKVQITLLVALCTEGPHHKIPLKDLTSPPKPPPPPPRAAALVPLYNEIGGSQGMHTITIQDSLLD